MRTGAARVTGRAPWIRRVSKKGIVFHSLRHTMATLLARAKMHPSAAQKILRHANLETTLAIYRHVDEIEEIRAAVAKLDFGPLEEQAPFKAVLFETWQRKSTIEALSLRWNKFDRPKHRNRR